MAFLLSLHNGVPRLKFPVGSTCTLGRSSECEIQLLDTELSRQHARIHKLESGGFAIEDLDSRNGTFVDGKRLATRVPLADGALVCLGSQVLCFNPPVDLVGDADGDKSLFLVRAELDQTHQVHAFDPSRADIARRDLLALHRLSTQLLAELDLSQLLERLIDGLMSHFGAERGFILGIDDSRSGSSAVRPLVIRTDKAAIALSHTLLDRVLREREPLLCEDALEDVSFAGARSLIEHSLRSVMLVPLLAEGRVIGVVQLDHRTRGAFDHSSLAQLALLSEAAALALHNAALFERAGTTPRAKSAFLGEDPQVDALLQQVARTAESDARVLITGESGTGKELIARMLHESSPRRARPWVAINCAALAETLLESELFGHEKGAFTHANQRKRGCFERAHGGTLFLDEVGELALSTQAKLLRALQEGRFYRVGGERPIDVDVRVIAATNRDLPTMVRSGQFREDLLFRLQVIPLAVPPLRARPADIPRLTRALMTRTAQTMGRRAPLLSPDAAECWNRYAWPGNVRELENAIERLIVLYEGALVTAAELPAEMREQSAGQARAQPAGGLLEAVNALEREMIESALARTGGVKARAARDLGISRPTLDKKMKAYDIAV